MSYNAVIVTGAGYAYLNGVYVLNGVENGKSKYVLIDKPDNYIYWLPPDPGKQVSGSWYIYNGQGGSVLESVYELLSNADTPWTVTGWIVLGPTIQCAPAPLLTPTNTLGMPNSVIPLLISRHGSVANFLRLRNQGQV
jgi:hypothetical protein